MDFEASSLGKNGYPIEVAWVFGDGEEESHLIRPAPSWTDWDAKAEAIHGISQDQLRAEGRTADEIAQRMMSVLKGCALYVTAPSWDGKWLSKLLRAAGLPRHALRLEDADVAHRQAIQGALNSARVLADRHEGLMHDILAEARRKDDEIGPVAHRALADARREQRLWLRIHDQAVDIVRRLENTTGGARGPGESARSFIRD